MAYTIQRGDNLSRIAKANNTTVSALMAANPQIKNANRIYAGDSLNIPGASGGSAPASTSGKGAGSTNTYGKGEYGGKYLGSNNNRAYSNMDNPPGSTGYETGVRINVNTGEQTPGVLPLGTSFRASGNALADAQDTPDSSGIFAWARGRTPGYLEHVSGYKGQGYVDAKGNYYDADGNYLREDGYFYEPNAQVSRNGMYQNTGGGMGSAQHKITGTPANPLTGTPANLMYERSGIYGDAPGAFKGFFGGGGGETQEEARAETPVLDPVISEIINPTKSYEDLERERRKRDLAQGGGLAW